MQCSVFSIVIKKRFLLISEASEELRDSMSDSVAALTRSQTRRETEGATTPGADCTASGSPVKESSKLVEPEPGIPVSQDVGANRDGATHGHT